MVKKQLKTVKRHVEIWLELAWRQGDFLYGCMNLGACGLSFVPGLIYDRLGCITAMVIGALTGFSRCFETFWAQTRPFEA